MQITQEVLIISLLITFSKVLWLPTMFIWLRYLGFVGNIWNRTSTNWFSIFLVILISKKLWPLFSRISAIEVFKSSNIDRLKGFLIKFDFEIYKSLISEDDTLFKSWIKFLWSIFLKLYFNPSEIRKYTKALFFLSWYSISKLTSTSIKPLFW